MKTFFKILFLSVLSFCLTTELYAQGSLTAEQVARKTSALISEAKGLTATFNLQGNGRTGKGWIKSSGKKFNVGLPGIEIWYNGKDLYTYNGRTGETTIITPSASELLESNPLLYVRDGGGAYNYAFSTVKRNGKYIVELTPRNKKNDINKLTITVNSSNFKPEKIVVSSKQGSMTLDITEFKTGATIPESTFQYSKSKYPKAEIVDLR